MVVRLDFELMPKFLLVLVEICFVAHRICGLLAGSRADLSSLACSLIFLLEAKRESSSRPDLSSVACA